jgi:hypothetical protein
MWDVTDSVRPDHTAMIEIEIVEDRNHVHFIRHFNNGHAFPDYRSLSLLEEWVAMGAMILREKPQTCKKTRLKT